MEKRSKVLSALGIAAKAGKIESGEFQTEGAIKKGRAYAALIAEDASEGTRDKFRSMCAYYEVPYFYYGTRETIGSCIGKDFRAVLAVTDEKLAELIRREIKTEVAKTDEST